MLLLLSCCYYYCYYHVVIVIIMLLLLLSCCYCYYHVVIVIIMYYNCYFYCYHHAVIVIIMLLLLLSCFYCYYHVVIVIIMLLLLLSFVIVIIMYYSCSSIYYRMFKVVSIRSFTVLCRRISALICEIRSAVANAFVKDLHENSAQHQLTLYACAVLQVGRPMEKQMLRLLTTCFELVVKWSRNNVSLLICMTSHRQHYVRQFA